MSIDSQSFGQVKLTDADARKFEKQVTYGRPKVSANVTTRDGVKLSKALSQHGSFKFAVKAPA